MISRDERSPAGANLPPSLIVRAIRGLVCSSLPRRLGGRLPSPPHPVGFSDLAASNRRSSVADVELLFDLLPEVSEPDVRGFRVPFRRVKLQVCDQAS